MDWTSPKSLVGLVTGTAMLGAAVFYSVLKEDNFGEKFERPSGTTGKKVELNVSLTDEYGKKFMEKLMTDIGVNKERDTLYFGIYTQDYNRSDWSGTDKEKVPPNVRHTGINYTFSRTVILYPSTVKISGIEQRAFLVPQYKWDIGLKPFEEHREAQLALKGTEKIVDWMSKGFSKRIFRGARNANSKERKRFLESILKTIVRKDYTASIIPVFIPNKILGYTETAREYRIDFDTSNLRGKEKAYIFSTIALGNPGKASSGSFPDKFGKLESYVNWFFLEGKKTTVNRSAIEPVEFTGTNGKVVVFTKSDNRGYETWYCNLETKERKLLIGSNKLNATFPSLSPNGEMMAFHTGVIRNKRVTGININVMNLENREIKKLVTISQNKFPGVIQWSENSEYLFFYNYYGGRRCCERNRIEINNGKIQRAGNVKGLFVSNLWVRKLSPQDREWCFKK